MGERLMARRRLSPTVTALVKNVPHAEHLEEGTALKGSFTPAPIARVAGDAAESAALAEVAREVTQARETGRLVIELPLKEIAPDYLTRDRIRVEDEEMAALRASIQTHGQRTPIEVTPLETAGENSLPYGLISGWRRLTVFKRLYAETGEMRFATIQALIRRPENAQAAYVAMVEENEIRVGLSYYERARVAALAVRRGIFETEKAALLALFATASRPKRSRIRSFLEIYHALDAHLRFPARLPERLGLKLVEVIRAKRTEEITEALARGDPQTPEAELEILEHQLHPAATKPRIRDLESQYDEILPDVTLKQSLNGTTLTLKFNGKGVTPTLAAEIRSVLLRLQANKSSGG
jgi:ParB family transcriptional regulator, chromosome partitioning protein